jgi:hypothetical protein
MSSTYIELRDVLNNLRHETSIDILRREKGSILKAVLIFVKGVGEEGTEGDALV